MSEVSRVEAVVAGLAGHAGFRIREERLRRRWTLADLAGRAGLSRSLVHWLEAGNPGSLESYVRIATALGLRAVLDLADSRRPAMARQADALHAAIVEALAGRVRREGVSVGVDEPYQHYQFAGRADLVAWSAADQALLHAEVRTRFPDLQGALGSYNAKRRWLARSLAERLALRAGFASVSHVIVALWSSEVMHSIRLHPATFGAACPDPPEAFEDWWHGRRPAARVTSSIILFDPVAEGRRDRRRFVGLDDALSARPRYRGYAEALRALDAAGRVDPGFNRGRARAP